MEPSQERPVIGSHLYYLAALGQRESFDHLLGKPATMRDPRFGLSTEIRIVGIEEDVSSDEVLRLH